MLGLKLNHVSKRGSGSRCIREHPFVSLFFLWIIVVRRHVSNSDWCLSWQRLQGLNDSLHIMLHSLPFWNMFCRVFIIKMQIWIFVYLWNVLILNQVFLWWCKCDPLQWPPIVSVTRSLGTWLPGHVHAVAVSSRLCHMGVMSSQITDNSSLCSTTCQANNKEISNVRFTDPLSIGFPSKRASNTESASMWRRHHEFDTADLPFPEVYTRSRAIFPPLAMNRPTSHPICKWFGSGNSFDPISSNSARKMARIISRTFT